MPAFACEFYKHTVSTDQTVAQSQQQAPDPAQTALPDTPQQAESSQRRTPAQTERAAFAARFCERNRSGAPTGARFRGASGARRRAPEVRRALLEEGAHALDIFVPRPASRCRSRSRSSCASRLFETRRGSARFIRPSVGRAGREPHGDLARHPHQLMVVDDAPDHAPGFRLLRADRIGEHHQRAGARLADETRQDVQVPPASGTRPIRAKACRNRADLRRQHDVAGERDIGPGAGRDAVDRADDRLRQRAQAPGPADCSACRATRRDRVERRRERWPGRRDPGRRKSPCRRRSRARRGTRSPPPPAERAASSASMQRDIEGVQPVGTVQGERQHAVLRGFRARPARSMRRGLRHGAFSPECAGSP